MDDIKTNALKFVAIGWNQFLREEGLNLLKLSVANETTTFYSYLTRAVPRHFGFITEPKKWYHKNNLCVRNRLRTNIMFL